MTSTWRDLDRPEPVWVEVQGRQAPGALTYWRRDGEGPWRGYVRHTLDGYVYLGWHPASALRPRDADA